MKRILAMLLSVICVLSFTCVSTYADEKSEDEEKAASIAESYLSAAAKNMWLYESNNLAEHTIQELVDPSGNSLLSDMSADVNTQKILSSMESQDILLLDEPFNALDESSHRRMCNVIKELKDKSTTILLTSHNMADILELCDEIYQIKNYTIEQWNPPSSLS